MRSQSSHELFKRLGDSGPNSEIISALESRSGLTDPLRQAGSSPRFLVSNQAGIPSITHPINNGEDLAKVWNNPANRGSIPQELIRQFGDDAISHLDYRDQSGQAALKERMAQPSLREIAQAYADLDDTDSEVDSLSELSGDEPSIAIIENPYADMSPAEQYLHEKLSQDPEFQALDKLFESSPKHLLEKLAFAFPIWGLFLEADKAAEDSQVKRNLRAVAELASVHGNDLVADIALTLADRHKARSNQHKRSIGFGVATAPVSYVTPGISAVGQASSAVIGAGNALVSKATQAGINYNLRSDGMYKHCRAILAFALSHKGDPVSKYQNDNRRSLDPNALKVDLQRQLGMEPLIDYSKIKVGDFQTELARATQNPPPNFMRLLIAAGEGDKIRRK